MASSGNAKAYSSHEERTFAAPRNNDLHHVTICSIEQANNSVRILRLRPVRQHEVVEFSPGQWLDVIVPGLRTGGFTITSASSLELAIRYAPDNPPAAWLWKPHEDILGKIISVRVGGSFVWPPPLLKPEQHKRVLLLAGGVGINPLISILAHLQETRTILQSVKLLYATRSYTADGSDILFLSRIRSLLSEEETRFEEFEVELYTSSLVSPTKDSWPSQSTLSIFHRRIHRDDLERALGKDKEQRQSTVCYICGPQSMTDEFVETIKHFDGMESDRVLCEKWW